MTLCRWLTALVALLDAAAQAGAAGDLPTREQFAFSLPIALEGNGAVYRLELPREVYRECVDPQLQDLRVLNGRGEVVPFALRQPSSQVRRAAEPVRLALFPLHGDPAAAVAALSLSVRDGNTQVELQRPPAAAESTAPSAYLLRADQDAPFESLSFEWAPDASDFAVNAVIETSADLVTWSPVTQRAPLARLRHDGQVIGQAQVSFRPTRARFWRVAPEPGKSLPEITVVSATPVADAADVERLRASAPGTAVAGEAGVYQFDLGAQLPVDRLEMELPDMNTAARVEFLARRGERDSWHSVTHAALYRLNSSNGEIRSPPLEIAADASRYWRVVVDQRGGGIGQGATILRVGWLPQVLVFVVRGPGPFELVYGNYGAPSAEVSLESLLPSGALRDAGGSLDTLPRAITGESRPAGGAGRLLAPPPAAPWRRWLLWVALCGGVFALAVVAWRLARQMRLAS